MEKLGNVVLIVIAALTTALAIAPGSLIFMAIFGKQWRFDALDWILGAFVPMYGVITTLMQ